VIEIVRHIVFVNAVISLKRAEGRAFPVAHASALWTRQKRPQMTSEA